MAAPNPKEFTVTSDRKTTPASGTDRFDSVERIRRVGAHRAVEKTGSTAVWVVTAVLLTLILTAVGVLIYTLQPSSVTFGSKSDPDKINTPAVVGEVAPDTTVVVLNGTAVPSLAFSVDEIINAEGWGSTLYAGDASEQDVEISAIFYKDPADEALAKGLGEKLGGISTYQNPNYSQEGNQLTVLLGKDYKGPGLEEALQTDGLQGDDASPHEGDEADAQ